MNERPMLKNELAMRDQSINRLLWQFSLPAIAGMLVSALYNIVDRIFVGRGVGSIAIAAITVAFPIMMIMSAISVLISIGATAQISIRLGEQRTSEAEKIAGNATMFLILVPIGVTIFYLLLADPILLLFGADRVVLPYARDFTRIIMLGSLFGTLSFGMNNFIRAEGNPHVAMYTQLIGAVINGILNYLFIFKLGMGIKGSALATVLGQLISTLWVLGYFFTGRSAVKIRLKNLRPRLSIFMGIAAIGLFTRDNLTLVKFTSHAMLVFFTLIPIMAFQVICSTYFQAVGKPLQATLLGLSRQVLIFIPLLLILPHFWGLNGVWRTAPIADALSTLITAAFIYHEMKKLPSIPTLVH